jgi:hypothetical protein
MSIAMTLPPAGRQEELSHGRRTVYRTKVQGGADDRAKPDIASSVAAK